MKKCLIIVLLIMLGVQLGYCPNNGFKIIRIQKYTDNEITLFAIIDYESAWKQYVINHKENAAGCLQIRIPVIKDVNRFYNLNYKLKDRFDFNKSIEIFWLYHKLWNNCTPEELARNWNGGPKGMYKTATLKYWMEIKKRIKKYEHLKYDYKIVKNE